MPNGQFTAETGGSLFRMRRLPRAPGFALVAGAEALLQYKRVHPGRCAGVPHTARQPCLTARKKKGYMSLEPPPLPAPAPADSVLQVYLLGAVDFEAALSLQRRLVYEVTGDRACAALVLCEHPPLITVGRQGSHAHILCGPEELRSRRWRIRWVNRGGGCLLHLPG